MTKDFPNCNYSDISKKAKKLGFYLARTTGSSHEIWRRDIDSRQTTIPNHGRKSIKRKTLKSIASDLGISVKDFK